MMIELILAVCALTHYNKKDVKILRRKNDPKQMQNH